MLIYLMIIGLPSGLKREDQKMGLEWTIFSIPTYPAPTYLRSDYGRTSSQDDPETESMEQFQAGKRE
jgi:hypothetical protein